MPEQYMCGAINPSAEPVWAVRCSLELRHRGPHRAHHMHDEDQRFIEWSKTDAEIAADVEIRSEP